MQITFEDAKKVFDIYNESSTNLKETFCHNFSPFKAIDYIDENRGEKIEMHEYITLLKKIGFSDEVNFIFAFMMGVAAQRTLAERESQAQVAALVS